MKFRQEDRVRVSYLGKAATGIVVQTTPDDRAVILRFGVEGWLGELWLHRDPVGDWRALDGAPVILVIEYQ